MSDQNFHHGRRHDYYMHEADGAPIHCQSVYTGDLRITIEKAAERASQGKATLLRIETARQSRTGSTRRVSPRSRWTPASYAASETNVSAVPATALPMPPNMGR